MKLNEIYTELLNIAKRAGINVRKEKGSFKSGYCVLNEKETIVLNPLNTLETLSSILAKNLTDDSIENSYIKPAIRDYIEKERNYSPQQSEFTFEVK